MNYNNDYKNIESPKRVLIGICGIGNGHVNRQRAIIDILKDYNVDIVLAITKKSYKLFDEIYPEIKKIIVNIPWIVCNDEGIDFDLTRKIYIKEKNDQFKSFLNFSISVKKAFNNQHPDIIFTDYEPNVAQYSYAVNKPLICLEQQSKFLAFNSDNINGYSINEEKNRLLYFFPRAEKRYVSSFFEIENNGKYNIETLPPILSKYKRGKNITNKVVVYFSPYSNDLNNYIKILELIKKYNEYKFHIYTDLNFQEYRKYTNLIFNKIGNKFKDDLYDCNFIISTSGHQLISEAINMEIPLYLLSLNTFEQNYNSFIVEKYALGKKAIYFSVKEMDNFISNITVYRNNMKNYKKNYWRESRDKVLFYKLEKEFGIQKK